MAQARPPRPSSTYANGQRISAMPTNEAMPNAMHTGTPSGFFLIALDSLRPVAVMRPAATAPMPRSAPATWGLSANWA